MPLFNMTDLRAQLLPGQRLLGIDPGSKSVGLALSDVSLLLASPHSTLKRAKLDWMNTAEKGEHAAMLAASLYAAKLAGALQNDAGAAVTLSLIMLGVSLVVLVALRGHWFPSR